MDLVGIFMFVDVWIHHVTSTGKRAVSGNAENVPLILSTFWKNKVIAFSGEGELE